MPVTTKTKIRIIIMHGCITFYIVVMKQNDNKKNVTKQKHKNHMESKIPSYMYAISCQLVIKACAT